MAASSVRFGAGVTREVGMDLVDLGVRRALVVTDPNLARLAPVQTVLAALDAAGVEAVLYDRVRVEPTDVSFRDAIQFAEAAPGRRDRGRRRRLGDRHGQGGEPLHDLSAGGFPRLRQRADRQGDARAGPAQAADRDSHDGRDRQRDDRRQHLRSHRAAREDRHREPPAQADARAARSREHADDAAAGGGVERARHPEPCHRVVHGDAVHVASAPASARRCVRPTRGRTRSATSGRFRRCASSRSTSSAPSRIRPTTRRARR